MANDTMAAATDLISELLKKIAELDQRVNDYRQDMAGEFQRYSAQLLKDRPREVTVQVEQAIADSAHKYPALISSTMDPYTLLHGGARDTSDATSQGPQKPRCASPPPTLPHTSGTPPDGAPRSPHERELEFHGLFTPSYLPLLEAVQRHSSPASPLPPPPQAPLVNSDPNRTTKGGEESPIASPTAPSVQPLAPVATASTPHPQNTSGMSSELPPRPYPQRRYTEDTICSITSDDSSKVRRSALRRSSSSSTKAHSPRRVRFDVEGEEVLPTASPLLSPRIGDLAVSPLGTNAVSTSDESFVADRPGSAEDSLSLLGSSPPQPKKVTSTERLKAMARSSTEDTSKWTVVGDADNGSDDDDEDLVMNLSGRNHRGPAHESETATTQLKSTPLGVVKEIDEEADSEEEEEDMLMMPSLSSFKNKKRFSPPEHTANAPGSPVSESTPNQQKDSRASKAAKSPESSRPSEVAEEDMFELEEEEDVNATNGVTRKIRETRKYIDEEEDDAVDATVEAPEPKTAKPAQLYSTSPAVSIPKPPAPEAAPASSSPPPRSTVGVTVGSYKGKPFNMNSVKDAALHEKASKMENVYSFIGSVDGRSGVDDSSSYRPDMASYSGTPRSFSERFIKEEREDEERRKVQGAA